MDRAAGHGGVVLLRWTLLLAWVWAAGCASNRDLTLSRLLADLEAGPVEEAQPAEEPRADEPEQPVAALPPPAALANGGSLEALTIQPDTLVQIRVEEDPVLDGSYNVNKIGAVLLGYIGPVVLVNMTEGDAAKKISTILKSRHFRKATVQVQIMRPSYDRVRVSGLVNRPGLVSIGAGDRIPLQNALLGAGGVSIPAAQARVRIVRDGLLSPVALSLRGEEYALVDDTGAPRVPDVFVANNDVVHVFSRKVAVRGPGGITAAKASVTEVLVLGEVKREGVFRFKPGEQATLLYLILKMGGLPQWADKKHIRILRMDQEGFETEILVNALPLLEEGNPEDDVPLENGDRVVVPPRKWTVF